MIILPTEKHKAKSGNPHVMVLFAKPKQGKTSFAASLEDNLIIDLEGGSEYLDAMSVQIRTLDELREVLKALKDKIKDTGKKMYKYLTIDSTTVLEDLAVEYALALYQKTPMAFNKATGKLYNESVLKLPNGPGYLYLREAFETLFKSFFDLADHIIFICHCKLTSIDKEGTEVSQLEIDLTGKCGRLLMSKAQAIGFMYRKDNKTMMNFKAGGDSIAGTWCKHLLEKEFVVAESDSEGNITYYPERIYLPESAFA